MSNDEIGDTIEVIKSLEDSGLLLKGVTKTVQNKVKEQKGGFISMLLETLGVSLLGNLLTGKRIYKAGKGKGINRAGEGVLRAFYGNKMDFYFFTHPLTNFEMQKYYHNQPKFNGVYSRDNLPKIKDGVYIINLDKYSDIGTHWLLFMCKIRMLLIFILLL